MSSFIDTIPYPFARPQAQQLFTAVVQAQPTVRSAVALAQDAGINTVVINDQQAVYFVWREIFTEAAAQGLLRALITTIRDRMGNASPVRAYLTSALEGRTEPVAAEPLSGDGAPRFIDGTDEVTKPEALLYHDDLTLQIGRLPALIKTLEQMRIYAPSVCKLVVDIDGESQFGTAFRIGKDLLLTNWHVVRSEDGIRTNVVHAEFGYEDDGQGAPLPSTIIPCAADSIIDDQEDDWAVIRVTQPLDPSWPVIRLSEAAKPLVGAPAYIIQHPVGARKRIGYVRNRVSLFTDQVVQYLTDTQEGSSGAPVFNGEGKLIALHHAGGRPQELMGRPPLRKNEGIRIPRITEGLKAHDVEYE